jgi:exopolyphosphatase / guanosine-5'-triphosphate,3'-diphosphate pyrophosphatase
VFLRQLLALRLAVILCHARRSPDMQGLRLQTVPGSAPRFALSCRKGWAEAYPQSAHLLREEAIAWEKTPCGLVLSGFAP